MHSRAQVGSPDNHDAFVLRHATFFETVTTLHEAEDAAFNRDLNEPSDLDRIVFYFGIRTAQDFAAITLLASQGLGLPATALLRGMYERVVIATYLRKHPNEASSFLSFDVVQSRRALNRLRESYEFTDDEQVAYEAVVKRFEEVKDQYQSPPCSTCGKRPMENWTKTDFVTMAKSLEPLGELLVPAYYVSLAQAHATAKSIDSLLRVEGDEIGFREDYTEECDCAFQLAHLLTIHALQLQVEYFGSDAVRAAVARALHDYQAVWRRKRAD